MKHHGPLSVFTAFLGLYMALLPLTSLRAQEGDVSLSEVDKRESNMKYRQFLDEQLTNSNGKSHLLAVKIMQNYSQDYLERTLEELDAQYPELLSEREVRSLLNKALMKKLHGSDVFDDMDSLLLAGYKSFQRDLVRGSGPGPDWAKAEISDREIGEFHFSDHLSRLKNWVEGKSVPEAEDMALNFVPSKNNSIMVLSDKEQFWPALMEDLEKAQDHIHINIFGFTGDAWGKEVTDLLAQKVQQGVKVRILADALGARVHWYFNYSNQSFIKELESKGIEVILTYDKGTNGNFHFDHRKFYVIDGRVAYNTGYTIEEHMRRVHFDMGMRIEGDMVKQIQSHFFTGYFHFGGRLPEGTQLSPFLSRYYPQVNSGAGTVKAKLLENIPNVQHRVTESYYDRIAHAKKKVTMINEFLSEPTFLKVVQEAANRGVELEIIYPRLSEWAIHRMGSYSFFQQFKDNPKVKVYLFDGPLNTGWLHTKGIVVDDSYINFGSTNMDAPSLFHNYELNLETTDVGVVRDVQMKIIDYAKKYSQIYNYPNDAWSKFKIWGGGILSTVPQEFGIM